MAQAVKQGPINLGPIYGLPKAQMQKLNDFLREIWEMPLLTPKIPPKENWVVFHDDDPHKALSAARLALDYASTRGAPEDMNLSYRQAYDNACTAAHFAQPLHIRSKATRSAAYFARLEGEYFARYNGEEVARVVGRNTELIGLVISTADLEYPNGGKEDAIREAAESKYALRNGYVVVGSINSIYYLFCTGTPPSWQFLADGKKALRRLSIDNNPVVSGAKM